MWKKVTNSEYDAYTSINTGSHLMALQALDTKTNQSQKARNHPSLVSLIMRCGSKDTEQLTFRPCLPGDKGFLKLPITTVSVDVEKTDSDHFFKAIKKGALTQNDIQVVMTELREEYKLECPQTLKQKLNAQFEPIKDTLYDELFVNQALEEIGVVGIKLIDQMQQKLLTAPPLHEIHFDFTAEAKFLLRLSWEAIAKHGRFPLPPKGPLRLLKLREKPAGAMHFVSASDSDAGYFYTMGIALSPEAQSLNNMDVSYGLDGELIVPGQAVSPIPPTLAMATRFFAASIPTSSNISEDIQSIPFSEFAHPYVMDIVPERGYMFRPNTQGIDASVQAAQATIKEQIQSYEAFLERTDESERTFLPDVGAAIDISTLTKKEMVPYVKDVLKPFDDQTQSVTALFLILDPSVNNELSTETEFKITPRVKRTCEVVDAAKQCGLKYVSVCDQNEDEWLPNLLEYFSAAELNYLANYSDERGIIICDGRPVDPVYTASTAAQRIQSVYTTLAVDILKMGMWLCLDALSARRVWQELQTNPHIPERMFLMPIGIVEPFSGFVDNRDKTRTPRAIIDPFEKIKFMIEEAERLGMPSLLTDTRHKSRWVLLGSVDGDLPPHLRESLGATPLIGYEKFMACEKLARKAGILLGQAGSIESNQIFWIISDTTFDAAQDKQNPATAFWTAETERVLRRPDGQSLSGDLQSQRRAIVMPFLSVINRTMESHAKIDGWLRYLETLKKGDESLRMSLLSQKESLEQLMYDCLDAQDIYLQSPNDQKTADTLQNKWNEYSQQFQSYHTTLKQQFKRVRDQVYTEWTK